MVEKILQYVRSLAVHKIHGDNQFRDDPMQLHCTFRQKLNPNKQASAEKIKTKLDVDRYGNVSISAEIKHFRELIFSALISNRYYKENKLK